MEHGLLDLIERIKEMNKINKDLNLISEVRKGTQELMMAHQKIAATDILLTIILRSFEAMKKSNNDGCMAAVQNPNYTGADIGKVNEVFS